MDAADFVNEPRSMNVRPHIARNPTSTSATMFANGTVTVRCATTDMGPGTYTSATQVAADALGLPVQQVS